MTPDGTFLSPKAAANSRLALLNQIQEKLKEMEQHLGGRCPCGHQYKGYGGYNSALTDISNYLKELE